MVLNVNTFFEKSWRDLDVERLNCKKKKKGISPLSPLLGEVSVHLATLDLHLFGVDDLFSDKLTAKNRSLGGSDAEFRADFPGAQVGVLGVQQVNDSLLDGSIGDCRLGRLSGALGVALVQFGDGFGGEGGEFVVDVGRDDGVEKFAVRHGFDLSRY